MDMRSSELDKIDKSLNKILKEECKDSPAQPRFMMEALVPSQGKDNCGCVGDTRVDAITHIERSIQRKSRVRFCLNKEEYELSREVCDLFILRQALLLVYKMS